jgi:hypothetical protein
LVCLAELPLLPADRLCPRVQPVELLVRRLRHDQRHLARRPVGLRSLERPVLRPALLALDDDQAPLRVARQRPLVLARAEHRLVAAVRRILGPNDPRQLDEAALPASGLLEDRPQAARPHGLRLARVADHHQPRTRLPHRPQQPRLLPGRCQRRLVVEHRHTPVQAHAALVDVDAKRRRRVPPALDAAVAQLARQALGRLRPRARDHDPPARLLVCPRDAHQRSALPRSRLTHDHDQLTIPARKLDRPLLLRREHPAPLRKAAGQRVDLSCDEALVDRRHPRLCDVRRPRDRRPLERPVGARRLPPVGQVEQLAPVVELLERSEARLGAPLSRRLERRGSRLPRRERRVELRQPPEHVPLQVACRRRRVAARGAQRLDRPRVEAVLDRRHPPRPIQIARRRQRSLRRPARDRKAPLLGRHQPAAALQRVEARRRGRRARAAFCDLGRQRRPLLPLPQALLDRRRDLVMARAPSLPQTVRDSRQLEVPPAATGRPLHLEPQAAEFLRELRPVGRPDLPLVHHPRPRFDRHDAAVRAQRPVDQDVRVELRVGRPAGDRASRRVLPARGQDLAGAFADDRVLVEAAADHRHVFRCVGECPVDRVFLGGLERRADLRRAERPDGRDRFRRRERRVDRHDRLAVRADPTEGLAADRVADGHQRVEGVAVDWVGAVEAERRGTFRTECPAARRLDSLAVLEVVVALLGRLRRVYTLLLGPTPARSPWSTSGPTRTRPSCSTTGSSPDAINRYVPWTRCGERSTLGASCAPRRS